MELDKAHQKMKQNYEEEIHRLRKELEARGGQPGVHNGSQGAAPPVLGNPGGNPNGGMFGAIMGSQGPPLPGGHPGTYTFAVFNKHVHVFLWAVG
jgi:glucose repression regulatory protein TUP1